MENHQIWNTVMALRPKKINVNGLVWVMYVCLCVWAHLHTHVYICVYPHILSCNFWVVLFSENCFVNSFIIWNILNIFFLSSNIVLKYCDPSNSIRSVSCHYIVSKKFMSFPFLSSVINIAMQAYNSTHWINSRNWPKDKPFNMYFHVAL